MNKQNHHAAIFDLDGTLLDTLDDLANAANAALHSAGYPQHPVAAYRQFVGNGLRMLVRRALPEGEADRIGPTGFDDYSGISAAAAFWNPALRPDAASRAYRAIRADYRSDLFHCPGTAAGGAGYHEKKTGRIERPPFNAADSG